MGRAVLDLTGQKIGKWTVVGPAGLSVQGNALWLCRCECGSERTLKGSRLRGYRYHVNTESKNPGCVSCGAVASACTQHGSDVDISGRVLGTWRAVRRLRTTDDHKTVWECVCVKCGTNREIVRGRLVVNSEKQSVESKDTATFGLGRSPECIVCAVRSAEAYVGAGRGDLNVINVVYIPENKKQNRLQVNCVCSCGRDITIPYFQWKYTDTKSCRMCARVYVGRKASSRVDNSEALAESVYRRFLSQVKGGAKKRSIEYSLTEEYVKSIFTGKCAITGVPIVLHYQLSHWKPRGNGERGRQGIARNTASLDRIDSSLGYIEGNVQWVHFYANIAKGRMSMTQLTDMCSRVVKEMDGAPKDESWITDLRMR